MRSTLLTTVCFLLALVHLSGQNADTMERGEVTFVSSQHIYVKFTSTKHIERGDTLLFSVEGKFIPGVVVKDKSSTSAVCTPVAKLQIVKGSLLWHPKKALEEVVPPKKSKEPKVVSVPDTLISATPPLVVIPALEEKEVEPAVRQKVKGRLSAASYSNLQGAEQQHRMRYAFVFQGGNIGKSKFSVDNYITFRHTVGEWTSVKENFNDALKVYSLFVNYDMNKTTRLSLGRKINHRISSMGAIDGLQAEKRFGKFLAGAIVGTRPDYIDYRFNTQLFQVGAYAGITAPKRQAETTFAFIEQRNQGNTDRRFAYFQHSSNLLKDVSLFSSFEVDLYQNINNVISNTPSLTNLLVNLRYRASKKLQMNVGYDNRKNIIFYESYKNYIDQLIDNETRQGVRAGISYRLAKRITWGGNGSWRFQKSNSNVSNNINSYLNFSRIPGIYANISLSVNFLETGYLKSQIYGIRMDKELIQGKLFGQLYYRQVNYVFTTYENKQHQEIFGMDYTWNLSRKLALHLYYEGTFDKQNQTFNRLNFKLIQRF